MTTLRGSTHNPSIVDAPFREEVVDVSGAKLASVLQEKIQWWEEFSETELGSTCTEFADPAIKQLDYFLGLPSKEFRANQGVSSGEEENIRRAELRGERKVWYDIKYELPRLKARLSRMGADGNKTDDDGPKWKTAPKKDG